MALLDFLKSLTDKKKDEEEEKVSPRIFDASEFKPQPTRRESRMPSFDELNLFKQLATGGVKTGIEPLDVIPRTGSQFIQNRVIQPLVDVPQNAKNTITNVKEMIAPDRTATQRLSSAGKAGLSGLTTAAAFLPGVDDAAFALAYETPKALLAGKSPVKAFTGEEYTGLGEALAGSGKSADVLNMAELPLILGLGAAASKKQAASRIGKTADLVEDEAPALKALFENLEDTKAGKPAFSYTPAAQLSDSGRVVEEKFGKYLTENFDTAEGDYNKKFGNVLNTDNARELSDDYNADRSRLSPAVHEPASSFVKKLYERRLQEAPGPGKENEVLFTAGGTGAGKTTAINTTPEYKTTADAAQIVYDTNLSSYESSKEKIEQALQAGKKVKIAYVMRDPVDAMVNGAVPRAQRMGRTVPIEAHIGTHVGSLETIKKLADDYASNDNVEIAVLDNSYGKMKAKPVPLDSIKNISYNKDEIKINVEKALNQLYSERKITPELFEGFTGRQIQEDSVMGTGPSGQPKPPNAGEIVDETPSSFSSVKEILEQKQSAVDGDIVPPPTQAGVMSETPEVKRVAIEEDGKLRSQQKPYFEAAIKYYDTTDDVKQTIEDLANQQYPDIQKARRGAITFEETRKLADSLGMSVEDVEKRQIGKVWNAEQVDAATRIYINTTQELTNVGSQVRALREAGEAIPRELELKQMDLAAQAQAMTATILGDNAEAGRALNIRKALKQALDTGDVKAQKLAEKMFAGDSKKAQEVVKRLSEFAPDDNLGRAKFLRSIKPSTTMEKIEEYWYNSVLSNSATHIVNSTSNAVASLMSIPEKAVAGTIDTTGKKLADLFGVAYKQDRYAAEVAGEIAGINQGVKNGFRRALHVMKNGITEGQVSKLELGKPQAIRGPVGDVINIPSRALAAEDEFFKGINYEMDIQAQAIRNAKQEGLKGAEYHQRVAELINTPTPQMVEKAFDTAKYKAFQSQSKVAGQLSRLRDIVSVQIPGIGKFKPLQFIIPFIQTPVNVFKWGMERSPVGLAGTAYKAISGAPKGDVLDSASRAVVGSMAMIPLAMYFTEGKITGAAPTNKKEKDAFYADGKLPWSVKIGGQWVSYNRTEPLNTILRQIATWHDSSKAGTATPTEQIASFVRSEARNMADQTFMTGVGNLMDAIEDPERFGQKFITDIIGGFVPSAVAATARATDDTVRQPETVLQSLQTRIPGQSEKVPAMESSAEPSGTAQRHTNEGIVRNILSNFAGIRSTEDKGTGYQENVQRVQAAEKITSDQRDQVSETADLLIGALSNPNKEEARQVVNDAISKGIVTPEVLEEVQDNLKAKVKTEGDSQEVSLIRGYSNETRARYVVDKLKSMDKEERGPWLAELTESGVLTENTMKAIGQVLQEEKSQLPLLAR